jgi:hypothetical protein
MAVAFHFLGDVRVEGETADDHRVEAYALHGFLSGFLYLARADRAVLGTDAHGDTADLAIGIGVFASRVQPRSGVRVEAGEGEPFSFAGVLDAGLLEIFQDHGSEILLLSGLVFGRGSVAVFIGGG